MSSTATPGNWLIRNATLVAIATVTFLVIGAALLLYRQTAATADAQAWVMHTHQVKENTEALLTQIETGMIAVRDYVLEGKEDDLKPYASAFDQTVSDNVYAKVTALRAFTTDNPVQQHNLDALEPGIKNFQAYLVSLIELRKSQNAAAPASIDPTNSKQLLDQLHGTFAVMIGEEDRLLAARAETDQQAAARTEALIFTALAVFYIASVLASLLCQKAERRAQTKLHQYIGALKRSNQELDDFAYIASHDLKEPLRGLTNNANFMRDDLGGDIKPEVGKRLDRMAYLCQRLEKLVDDLLYFSRLGRQELAIQKTDLNEVIKDINLTMESTLRDANAVIVTPEALPTIVCDLPRVTEVFRNLIVNGVKYNKNAEKRIEIGCVDQAPKSAGNDNAARAFYVRDNGIGIAKEFYNDVFRIFKRLNAEDDSVKGTGVGLTFVRKIIERHGGKIWLDSEIGKGTTFYFTLNTKKEAS